MLRHRILDRLEDAVAVTYPTLEGWHDSVNVIVKLNCVVISRCLKCLMTHRCYALDHGLSLKCYSGTSSRYRSVTSSCTGILEAIFQVNLGFTILLELRTMEVVVTTGAIRCAKIQSNHQTNNQLFTGRMHFLSPNQQCQSTKGNLFETNNCFHLKSWIFRLDAWALSVIATATWLAGWLTGCPSHSGIVSKRLNLSENFFDHLKATSF